MNASLVPSGDQAGCIALSITLSNRPLSARTIPRLGACPEGEPRGSDHRSPRPQPGRTGQAPRRPARRSARQEDFASDPGPPGSRSRTGWSRRRGPGGRTSGPCLPVPRTGSSAGPRLFKKDRDPRLSTRVAQSWMRDTPVVGELRTSPAPWPVPKADRKAIQGPEGPSPRAEIVYASHWPSGDQSTAACPTPDIQTQTVAAIQPVRSGIADHFRKRKSGSARPRRENDRPPADKSKSALHPHQYKSGPNSAYRAQGDSPNSVARPEGEKPAGCDCCDIW